MDSRHDHRGDRGVRAARKRSPRPIIDSARLRSATSSIGIFTAALPGELLPSSPPLAQGVDARTTGRRRGRPGIISVMLQRTDFDAGPPTIRTIFSSSLSEARRSGKEPSLCPREVPVTLRMKAAAVSDPRRGRDPHLDAGLESQHVARSSNRMSSGAAVRWLSSRGQSALIRQLVCRAVPTRYRAHRSQDYGATYGGAAPHGGGRFRGKPDQGRSSFLCCTLVGENEGAVSRIVSASRAPTRSRASNSSLLFDLYFTGKVDPAT